MTRSARGGLLALTVLIASACGTGPEDLELAGNWQGSASLPSAFMTNLSLTQSGITVSGTIQISGLLNQAFVGTLETSTRTLDWLVLAGCEEWSGTFTINSDSNQMSGPVEADLSGCPGTDITGTITVTKQ